MLFGWLVYRGALKLNLRTFFAWTGLFLIVVAAGVLSYGVHDLQEAGILPGLNNLAFDVSSTVPPSSWYGSMLKGVFNFTPATTWLQAFAWIAYIVPDDVLLHPHHLGLRAVARRRPRRTRGPRLRRLSSATPRLQGDPCPAAPP